MSTIPTVPVYGPADADVQLQVLNLIVRRIEQGQSLRLVEAGLPADLLDDLRELKHADMARLVEQPLGVSIRIEAPVLHHQIRVLNAQTNERRMVEYFIAAQAPVSLLRQCFNLARTDITLLRRAMHVSDEAGYGRVREADRKQIEAFWLAHKPAAGSSADQLITFWSELHKGFSQHTLATLYSVIQSFERLGHATAQHKSGGRP